MLTELHISNFAIIEEAVVHFGTGLNVLSGETGAGKSIILHALELILGARPKAHSVREGADTLELQALIDLSQIHPSIMAELPDIARHDELVLTRTVQQSGKGRIYVNGKLATAALLEEVASKLINICGQTHHVRLLEPRYHLELIDDFAENEPLLSRYRLAYTEWRRLSEALANLEARTAKDRERREELESIITELERASVAAGLRERLESEVRRLGNAERLIEGTSRICAGLVDEGGALHLLAALQGELTDLARIDSSLRQHLDLFSTALTELREVETDLRSSLSSLELDEESLETLRERLAELARLERKYRTDDAGLVEILSRAREEIVRLDDGENPDSLRQRSDAQERMVADLSAQIRCARERAGVQLSAKVREELRELNMKHVTLDLSLTPTPYGPHGADRGELLLSSNKGEPLKPLRQIASGGELSRIMLVLKKIIRDRSGVNVLVFDEVDTGVSGGVARAVGIKLRELAQRSQVICITHLPQVASLADTHLRVEKRVEGERTYSAVKTLTSEERVEEIARMLAGYRITDAARESARELLSSAG